MRLLNLIILCLCTISVYAQANKSLEPDSDLNGHYLFSKAIASAYNYDTKAEAFTHTFSDTTSLKGFRELPFPVQPVFLSADIQSGTLVACRLWNNGKEYSVQEDGRLLVPAKEINPKSEGDIENTDIFSTPYRLSSLYTLDVNGNTVTFTFNEPYGNSRYNFPLEGKFTLILVRDESSK